MNTHVFHVVMIARCLKVRKYMNQNENCPQRKIEENSHLILTGITPAIRGRALSDS